MKHDETWTQIARDKAELRRKNAAKPFAEKLRDVERMRERDDAIRRTRGTSGSAPRPASK